MKVVALILVVAAVNAAPVREKRNVLNTLTGLLGGGRGGNADLGTIVNGLGSLIGSSDGGSTADALGKLGGLLGGLTGGDGSGSSDVLGTLGGLIGNLAGGSGRPDSSNSTSSTGGSQTGGSQSGSTSGGSGALGGAISGMTGGTLGAIGGLSDGLFNLGKTIISEGQKHPSNGGDIHHHAAEHGAQSAILKALQNGHFDVGY